MFEQIFKNIDDTVWKDAGCSSELDYVEQTSWVLFLKYLNDLKEDKKASAKLSGKTYTDIINKKFRWDVWAALKNKDGMIDINNALFGDDLRDFVDQKLFPYLRKFKTTATGPDTIEFKIGEIFSELKDKIQIGLDDKQKDFLDFILSKYIETGVSELAQEKLPNLLELKYRTITDASEEFGGVDKVRETFISFQKYLYQASAT